MFASFCCKSSKAFALLLTVWLSLGVADAQPIWKERLPTDLRVLGSGEMTWFGFRIYSARLWSRSMAFDPDQPYALELTYARSISRDEFVEASVDEISRLSGMPEDHPLLKRWQQYMQKAFVDVAPGEQLIGVHWPGVGCAFYSANKLLAEFKDPEFAREFFAIWLDPRTKDRRLREQLIGRRSST